MNRREFLTGAASATIALAGCHMPHPRHDAVYSEIARQIAAGYYDSLAAGLINGSDYHIHTSPTSLFEIASVSKTMTALLAARLAAAGRLDLDAPITTYLPDHALAKSHTQICLRDLAAHCAGFTDGWMGRVGIYGGHPWPYPTDDAFEKATLAQLPVYPLRSRHQYSCHNFILIGFILERLTGKDLDSLARELIWNPLGMSDTRWTNCPDDPRCVQIYTGGKRPLGTKGDEKARGMKRPIGNAGVFSNLRDLKRYAADLLNRATFEPAVYDLLFTPYYNANGDRRSFGWDMSLGAIPRGWSAATICHAGYTGQYVAIDPLNHRAAVVLTNLRLTEPKARARAYAERRKIVTLMSEANGSREWEVGSR